MMYSVSSVHDALHFRIIALMMENEAMHQVFKQCPACYPKKEKSCRTVPLSFQADDAINKHRHDHRNVNTENYLGAGFRKNLQALRLEERRLSFVFDF